MLESVIVGGGFALAASLQPGPLQAFLLSRVAATGWRRTLPACLAPIVSDGPIAMVVLLVLGRLTVGAEQALRAAGGVLLLYFAWAAFRQWQRPTTSDAHVSAPRTLLQAALVNLLNPNPYLAWALVLGPATITAWRRAPVDAVALVVAFYGTMTVMLALFIMVVGSARYLGPERQRGLIAVSAVLLAALGVYLLGSGALALVLART